MSVERAVQSLKARHRALNESVWGADNWEAFLKMKGIREGLQDAIAALAEEAKREGMDD